MKYFSLSSSEIHYTTFFTLHPSHVKLKQENILSQNDIGKGGEAKINKPKLAFHYQHNYNFQSYHSSLIYNHQRAFRAKKEKKKKERDKKQKSNRALKLLITHNLLL